MPARIRILAAAGLVAAATLLGACASAPSHDPFGETAPAASGLVIAVENDNVLDVRVYVLRGNVPIPVGSVGSAERRVFRLSPAELGHMGALRLIAEPLGSRERYVSDVIQVAPGERVEWHLAHRLSLSSVTVRF